MPITRFSAKHKKVLDEMVLPIPGVKAGKMFGLPGHCVGGKTFACVREDGASLKVPEKIRGEFPKRRGVEHFVPMENGPMKEWVLVTRKNSRDHMKLEDAFVSAIEYALSQSKKKAKP